MASTLGVYSDVVEDASGRTIAGATVSLYPVSAFAAGTLPTAVPGFGATAQAVTDGSGVISLRDVVPDDYHVLVQYTPAGGVLRTVWRYNVAVLPAGLALKNARQLASARGIARTLAKLQGGEGVTICCVGEDLTVGYNATGTVSGGWVARLATRLAGFYPGQGVTRFDPSSYATTLDAPIPAWSSVAVQAAAAGQPSNAVINAGVSADSVMRVFRRIANLTTASWNPPPDLYVVLLGYGEMSGDVTRATDLATFAAHLTGLVNVLRAGGAGSLSGALADVLLCTLPVIPPGQADYSPAVRQVAAATGAALCDLRQLWADQYNATAANDGYGTWMSTAGGDHLHPTDAGHAAIGDEIAKAFDPAGALAAASVEGVGAEREQVRVLNTSALLTYTGSGWSTSGAFQLSTLLASGAERQTSHAGDKITFQARFSDLYMLCRRWVDGGQVQATIDGIPGATVDLYRAYPTSLVDVGDTNGAIAPQDRVPLATGLQNAVHTVTVTLLATKNPASGGTLWRFDALEMVRARAGGAAIEGPAGAVLESLQRGSLTVNLAAAATGSATLTFPVPFTTAPTVQVTSGDPQYVVGVSAISQTQATVSVAHRDGTVATAAVAVYWTGVG